MRPYEDLTVPAPRPDYPKSAFITKVTLGKHRCHKGDGDMWPITWAADDHLYAGGGDNSGSPMNFWRVVGDPKTCWHFQVHLLDNMPVEVAKYCQIPPADPKNGIKPAGLLSVDGRLYFAVEAMNYGEDPAFRRQRNVHGWIITSDDYGETALTAETQKTQRRRKDYVTACGGNDNAEAGIWNRETTPTDFFTGRLSSCHFLQFGKDYAGARDGYVYAYFPGADDGNSYWENGDYLLLGRVPRDRILDRSAWEFVVELPSVVSAGSSLRYPESPRWDKDDGHAVPVFRYPLMCGEDHVSYNPGIGRYLLGNYSFIDGEGRPRPYHQAWPESAMRSQLTLFEAPEPWGPWSLFHLDDDWGTYGDYQPVFPTKWMSEDGKTVHMVSSGSEDDYNFTVQRLELEVTGG